MGYYLLEFILASGLVPLPVTLVLHHCCIDTFALPTRCRHHYTLLEEDVEGFHDLFIIRLEFPPSFQSWYVQSSRFQMNDYPQRLLHESVEGARPGTLALRVTASCSIEFINTRSC